MSTEHAIQIVVAVGGMLVEAIHWYELEGPIISFNQAYQARNRLLNLDLTTLIGPGREKALRFVRTVKEQTRGSLFQGWETREMEADLDALSRAVVENGAVKTDNPIEGWGALDQRLEQRLPRTHWLFLKFMWGKEKATFDTIMNHVNGNEDMEDKSIVCMISKVNSRLLKLRVPVKFKTKSLVVFSQVLPS